MWIADVNSNRVLKLDHVGTPILELPISSPTGIWVDPRDGSIWTSEYRQLQQTGFRHLVKFSPTGTELAHVAGFSVHVAAIVGDARAGNIWVADRMKDEVVILREADLPPVGYDASAPAGPAHRRITGFFEPKTVALGTNDSPGGADVWVGNLDTGVAIRISAAGAEVARLTPSIGWEVRQVEVDPLDDSIWLRLVGEPVVRFSAAGVETLTVLDDRFVQTIELDAPHRIAWLGYELNARAITATGRELIDVALPEIHPPITPLVRDIEIQSMPR